MSSDPNDPDLAGDHVAGLRLHEWQSEWVQIDEDLTESPDEALGEAVDLLTRMAQELGEPVDDAGSPPTEDVPGELENLRETALRLDLEPDTIEADDLADAVDRARLLYGYLISDRGSSEVL